MGQVDEGETNQALPEALDSVAAEFPTGRLQAALLRNWGPSELLLCAGKLRAVGLNDGSEPTPEQTSDNLRSEHT